MLLKNRYFKAALLFILSFPICLALWLSVKDYYGIFVIKSASFLVDSIFETYTVSLVHNGDLVDMEKVNHFFTKDGKIADLSLSIKIKISSFTFNFPLTAALVLSLIPLVKITIRHIFVVMFVLFFVHLLYVFSFMGLQEYSYHLRAGLVSYSSFKKLLWEWAWAFTDNLFIRFEPFLAPVYLYLTGIKKGG